ncbi:MAG TPA: hypothetical protein VL086_11835 [Candidatus Nitrosotalea sp.]|nr:hypothetical protein [Candidatus Nitrosotalea sp.]
MGRPRFPFGVARYGGAPVPLLAGNPLAHANAVGSCRAVAERLAAPEW